MARCRWSAASTNRSLATGKIAAAIVVVLLVAACGESPDVQINPRALSYEMLMNGGGFEQPVRLTEFTPRVGAGEAANEFSGLLELSFDPGRSTFDLLVDELDYQSADAPGLDTLPPFRFRFVQSGRDLIPLEEGPVRNMHRWWEYTLAPGRVWDEPDDRGFSRAVIPFALKERNEDCIHNGLLTFLFDSNGRTSSAAFQISQQTCSYLQFEWRGMLDVNYEPAEIAQAEKIKRQFNEYMGVRMPVRPIADIALDYPGAAPESFGSSQEIPPGTMTVFGFVIDGIHFAGPCATPQGEHPICGSLALPSYSTAKSFVAGLAVMRAEKLFPGISATPIRDVVPECGPSWDDVTIEHALDMTTGHFESGEPHADENAAIMSGFFTADGHAGKVDYACNAYERKAGPGETWVYQTWSSYLAGAALNARLKAIEGPQADFYRDLLVEDIWRPLGLSRLAATTRRTADDVAQPFSGFGVTFYRDDVAKLANFIGALDGRLGEEEMFDLGMFDAIKGRVAEDPGLPAEIPEIRYNNGFRVFDVSQRLGCKAPTYVTTMSGFGGINIVLMPNDTAYYYFSDGHVHKFITAVRESHGIRAMC